MTCQPVVVFTSNPTKDDGLANRQDGQTGKRTVCSTNQSTSTFFYVIGDYGSSKIDCSDSDTTPPANLVEFTLNGSGGMDFYDVRLIDIYNLPMLVSPTSSTAYTGSNCTTTDCLVDLIGLYPQI
ncbi:hypothetical protein M5K25_008401 [Dendrobium thyrsiflorum]|uniref:Uncharacterized protein n=1 Tax=Dendrobium thyrsiflorum TaxID=117978 RepID=A0ABD0V9R9_DENTH